MTIKEMCKHDGPVSAAGGREFILRIPLKYSILEDEWYIKKTSKYFLPILFQILIYKFQKRKNMTIMVKRKIV